MKLPQMWAACLQFSFVPTYSGMTALPLPPPCVTPACSRLNLQYQFSNYLNFRIISEHNTFSDRFYIQPLIQWNPNPATIFYLGGNQNTLEIDDDFTPELFHFTRSQFFLKFQYLFGI